LLALAYVKRGSLAMGERCMVTVLGKDRAAIRHDPAQYDPENRRLKA
jgi:dimethylglycine dehydrogenase